MKYSIPITMFSHGSRVIIGHLSPSEERRKKSVKQCRAIGQNQVCPVVSWTKSGIIGVFACGKVILPYVGLNQRF